jgi:peptide/nickel transport system substrate-binding protein
MNGRLAMNILQKALWILVIAMASAACAPPTRPADQPTGPAERVQPAPSRTLVLIARGEPPSLAVKPLQAAGGIANINPIFNATLDYTDERGARHPLLAEGLPQLNTNTWRVFPDGRMETTYRLKPNLSWHDGTPVTADDFRFALQVYAVPALGVSGTIPISAMEEVVAPDPRTVTIRWRQPFPDADALVQSFQALPRHLLVEAFQQGDWDSFPNHPFWTHEYVGLGPFRLVRWEPGAAIEAAAFDRYVLGLPKIERMRIVFMSDANTAVASLLSGEAHIAIDYLLMYEQGAVLEREWAARGGGGAVLFSPLLYRNGLFQFRQEMAATPAIQDVRFRRALTHAVDMVTIIDVLLGGKAILTHSLLSPRLDYYPTIERVITKYPYDTRRAQQLLDEVGLPKGSDGFYVNPNGEPFRFEVRFITNPTQESENAIIVEAFRRLGISAVSTVIPPAQLRDGLAVATYSGIHTTGAAGWERGMAAYSTSQVRRPETRWQGSNSGGWSNPEFDRLWDAYNTTLDRSERIQQLAQMEKIFTEELPAIPHYYTPVVAAHAAALKGPVTRATRDCVEPVHIHLWEWRS